jgi:hypothetical protein
MKITQPFWDHNGRKYIEIDGIGYKVPWRYNRVTGLTIENTTLPVQLLELGTEVTIEYIENMGTRVLKRIFVHNNG